MKIIGTLDEIREFLMNNEFVDGLEGELEYDPNVVHVDRRKGEDYLDDNSQVPGAPLASTSSRKKLHWTQRPENKEKLSKIRRKAVRTKKAA